VVRESHAGAAPVPDVAAGSFDWDARRCIDPHPTLHRMRTCAPAYFDTRLRAWVLTSHAGVLEALRSPLMGQVEQQKRIDDLRQADHQALAPLRAMFRMWAGQASQHDHARFAALARPALAARRIQDHRPRIQAIMDGLLAAAARRQMFDAANDLAKPFAMAVIADFLGIPLEHAGKLRRCVDQIAGLFALGTRDQLYACQAGMLELHRFLGPIVARCRAEPAASLIGLLARPDAGLDDEFVIAQCTLFLAAGYYPTANLLANGLQALLEDRRQTAVLRAAPELLASAVEEMARFCGPPFSTRKVANADITFHDRTVRAGESVVLALAAANRDPAVFPDPDRLDVGRSGLNMSLAFGTTPYHCVGRPLVRAEGEVFFGALLKWLPGLQPLDVPPDWVPLPPFGRELRTLRVRHA
jgi:cytochrome P450